MNIPDPKIKISKAYLGIDCSIRNFIFEFAKLKIYLSNNEIFLSICLKKIISLKPKNLVHNLLFICIPLRLGFHNLLIFFL